MKDQELREIIDKLLKKAQEGKLNFALAIMYCDQEDSWQFEAHTAGKLKTLKQLFEMDTNAEAEAQIHLKEQATNHEDVIYFNLPAEKLA